MKKKSLAKFCCLVMSMSLLAGCGNQATETETPVQDSVESVSTEAVAESSAEVEESKSGYELPLSEETVTFTIAVQQMSALKSAEAKQCVIDTEEATNVHIEWIEIPNSGWEEKINLMFNTGDLPDAIIGGVDVVKYYDQLVAVDEYLEEYAPNVAAYFDEREDYPEALITSDGHVYSLPTGDETMSNMIDSQLWINKSWLDKLGLSMPTTADELKDVLIAFRDNDPNGNGKKDEIPFTFKSAWGWGTTIENFFGTFGVLENGNHVITVDGKVIFCAGEDGYYDALAYMNDLYKEGLIDKDAFTLSGDQYSARGSSGGGADEILGLVAGYKAEEAGVLNSGDYVVLPLLTNGESGKMVGVNNVTKSGGFSISKTCKNPEMLVSWYDYINSNLEMALKWGRGPEGVIWSLDEVNGEEVPKFLTVNSDVLAANGGYASKSEFRTAESFAGQTPALWRYEYFEILTYDETYPPEVKLEAVKSQIEYGVSSLPAGMTESVENAERRAILLTDIENYLTKFVANSVINGIDDAKWEEHLKVLESLKVEEYTALCQEFVDSLK